MFLVRVNGRLQATSLVPGDELIVDFHQREAWMHRRARGPIWIAYQEGESRLNKHRVPMIGAFEDAWRDIVAHFFSLYGLDLLQGGVLTWEERIELLGLRVFRQRRKFVAQGQAG